LDYRQLLSDPALRSEFFDRIDEIAENAGTEGGLEGLEGGISLTEIRTAAESMSMGRWESSDPGLEAIIRRFLRPVYLVQRGTFSGTPDRSPSSHEMTGRLETARSKLNRVIASTGRIDLRNHQLEWVGTGWMVAPRIVVTNRHVAEEFGRAAGHGFAFKRSFGGRRAAAYLDWRQEYLQDEESRFRVEEITWIEPDDSVDVALLLIRDVGEEGEKPPTAVSLMTEEEIKQLPVGTWIAVIGYPGYDSRYDARDQQRIFDGIYNVKRLSPGQVTSFVDDQLLYHDATTLGGSSGSVVVDLASGKALGLHFNGLAGQHNTAVLAPYVARIAQARAGAG
jgi:V8-like Glu-specific endopeptidase